MSAIVTVEATWRISRAEFNAPHSQTGMVYGYGEVLLQEPDTPSSGASIFKPSSSTSLPPPPLSKDGEKVTYGVMMGSQIARAIADVLEDKIELRAGVFITFADVLEATSKFLEQWRQEDLNKPPPEPLALPQAAALTAVVPPPDISDVPPPG